MEKYFSSLFTTKGLTFSKEIFFIKKLKYT